MSASRPTPASTTNGIARATTTIISAASRTSGGDEILTPSLTTTFTPPSECTQGHLTMLKRESYFVWLNAPLPVFDSTFSSCYPDAFMTSYLQSAVSSTTAGPFSPLVCPSHYATVSSRTMSDQSLYMVCCPSGYGFAPAKSSVPLDRPYLNGTCFSDILTTTITQYDDSTSTGIMTFTTPGQAYAHPLDGFAIQRGATTTRTSTLTTNPSLTSNPNMISAITSTSMSSNASTPPVSNPTNRLSPGSIAGIAIGAVGALAILVGLAGFFFFFRSRRRAAAYNDEKAADQNSRSIIHQPWSQEIYSSEAKQPPYQFGETEIVEMPLNEVYELPNRNSWPESPVQTQNPTRLRDKLRTKIEIGK